MEQKSKFETLGLFDAKVPRYTSYPTAPHFNGAVSPDIFKSWVRAITPGSTISLYLHVPFCRRLCWFCACRTQGTQTLNPVALYLDTLKAEIDMLAAELPPGVRLNRMHWGGGTPTLLTGAMIEELAGHVANVLPFAPGAEFSVEIDPSELDANRVEALARSGMTRASIGVQDFDPEIQQIIGREQSFEITAQAVDMLRDAGVSSLNTDILFGLPKQTKARITTSVQKLLSLAPDRVALYGYAHVPWMARRQQLIPSDALPSPQERLGLFEVARKLFQWDGYSGIGIDHFALHGDGLEVAQRTGTLRRNFQGYTDDTSEVLIGLGASAISRFPQGYAQNNPATSAYSKAVRNRQFATHKGHSFSSEDHLRGRLIETIMCEFEVNAQDHPVADRPRIRAMMSETARQFDGAVKIDGDRLWIPSDARALTRLVARSFDAYEMDAAGHSSAI